MSDLNEMIAQLQIGESLTIGRGDVEVRITDVGVSAKHTRIERRDNGFHIRDLSSNSGTFVNKKKLTGSQRLKSGDHIKIGKTEWTFTAAKVEAAAPENFEPVRRRSWLGFFWGLIFVRKR